MIDSFVLSHPAIILTDDCISIRDTTIFKYAYQICCEKTLPPIPLEIFDLFKSAHVQSLHVELQMEQYLVGKLPSGIHPMEQRLIESILLHRFKKVMQERQLFTHGSGRAVAVMGTMIQHRLTQLSLALETGQHDRVFELGKMPALDEKLWKNECLGATAVARVIQAICCVDGVVVRFPTVHEDVDLGIDLFVDITTLSDLFPTTLYHLAISIKSMNQRKRLQVEHIYPHSSAAQFKVFTGARSIGEKFGREFIPIHMIVGRSEQHKLDMSMDDNDVQEIEQVLDGIEASLARSFSEQQAVA